MYRGSRGDRADESRVPQLADHDSRRRKFADRWRRADAHRMAHQVAPGTPSCETRLLPAAARWLSLAKRARAKGIDFAWTAERLGRQSFATLRDSLPCGPNRNANRASNPWRTSLQAFALIACQLAVIVCRHTPHWLPTSLTVRGHRRRPLEPLCTFAQTRSTPSCAWEGQVSAGTPVRHQPRPGQESRGTLLSCFSRVKTAQWCSRRESNPEPWD